MNENNADNLVVTPSQVASWYHSKILRIPHGNQNPTKRYLGSDRVLDLFDGTVVIQEKVDGKMTWEMSGSSVVIVEDMTGKHTVHDHVMKYTDLPDNKKIVIDMVNISIVTDIGFLSINRSFNVISVSGNDLDYAVLMLRKPCIGQVYGILEWLSKSPSHFGARHIEGLVVKNYDKQLFGKWVNTEFEDKL